jgi:HlyD family secretion protein
VTLALAAVAIRVVYFRPAVVPVTVTRVGIGPVEDLVTNNRAGSVAARRHASLATEIGGRVVRLPVDEGDRVRKGEVLLELLDTDLRAQVVLQERSLDAARAASAEACATADHAGRELDRSRRLLATGAIAEQALAEAETRRTASVAACSAATARIAQAAAAVDVARATLAKTVLRAPFDAVVTTVTAHVGEWLTPSPPGLPLPSALELVDVTSIYVRAPLDEVEFGRVRIGLPVRITMDAFAGQTFPGRVTRIGAFVSEAQQQNRTFDIDVAFDDPSFARRLLPGTSADVSVILEVRAEAIRVPTSALLPGGRVLVVRDDTLASVVIRSGLANWEYTEVLEGLAPGDRVVLSLDRPEVREGARVVATELVR